MNTQAAQARILADTTATSETAYKCACDEMFSLWASLVRSPKTRELAKTIRSLLSCFHATWSEQQACPPYVAARFCELAALAAAHRNAY